MKKMKRTWAILLALVLTVALAVPGFAAEGEYSITITNDKAGHTYEAYQIFAGTVASDAEQVGNETGPMLGNITWGDGVNGDRIGALLAALKADANLGALPGMANAANAADVAAALDGANAETAAAFADVVSGFLANTPTGQTNEHVDGTSYVIDGLPAGYYLVRDANVPATGTATEYIVQVLGNVTMEPKDSDIPTVEKKVYDEEFARADVDGTYGTGYNDVADWDIGDRVPFKLIATVPQNIDAYEEYMFVFNDTLSNGLTLDADSINVYVTETTNANINDFDPQANTLYEVSEVTDGAFSITIQNIKALDAHNHPANYIIITYDATLNEDAVIGLPGNPNSVDLQFSNDPNGDGLGRTTEDRVIVFTYELGGTKVDGENNATLPDAQFVLFNGGHTRVAQIDANGRLSDWLEPDVINHDVTGNNDAERMANLTAEDFANYNNGSLLITSDEDGLFSVAGLDDGTYYLREIKAPDGYNLLEDDLQIVITATTTNGQTWNGVAATALTALTISVDDAAAENGEPNTGAVAITVENNGGSTLPETGGIGTTIFYAAGALLVLCAGVLLFVKLRMRKAGDE